MLKRFFKKAAVIALVLCMTFTLAPVTASAKTTTKSTKTTTKKSTKKSTKKTTKKSTKKTTKKSTKKTTKKSTKKTTKKSTKKTTKKTTKTTKVTVTQDDLIYFGDCRTVGLGQAIYGYGTVSSNYKGYVSSAVFAAHCVAKVGANRLWAKEVGIYQVFSQLSSNPDAYVICNFGMNDLNWFGYGGRTTAANEQSFASEYVSVYKQIKTRYPNAHIVIMSVNPVIGSYAQSTNSLMAVFNSYLKQAAADNGWTYVDTNSLSVFKQSSTYAGDGVHFSSSAYQAIHSAVLASLQEAA